MFHFCPQYSLNTPARSALLLPLISINTPTCIIYLLLISRSYNAFSLLSQLQTLKIIRTNYIFLSSHYQKTALKTEVKKLLLNQVNEKGKVLNHFHFAFLKGNYKDRGF